VGGHETGSLYNRGASRAEEMRAIDLADLKRHRLLRSSSSGSWQWSRAGEVTASIGFTLLSTGLRLQYRTRHEGEQDWTNVDEHIPFAWTDMSFGGQRCWLTCLSCGRRCRVLYGGTYFRCRQCRRLTYESQYERPWQRLISQAAKLRMKLGGSGSMEEPFPRKPKGMHWTTYWRLEGKDVIARQEFAAVLDRLLRQFGAREPG
jgi:hypothetical protein